MPKRIVWILGSGFSAPLGAPTLAELLSLASKATMSKIFFVHQFPKLYDGDYFHASYKLFDHGKSIAYDKFPQIWTDAEQYLDYLDAATTFPEGLAAARFSTIINRAHLSFDVNIQRLADTTRRIIAAECSVFLEDKPTDLEIWQPYIRWAKMLNKNHTIITFNYDRVLEILAGLNEIDMLGSNSFFGTVDHDQTMAKEVQTLAGVIKLHGSVDWRKNTSQFPPTIERGDSLEALKCNSDQLVIATPGPTKHKMVSEILAVLWTEAEKILRQADIVFFIGYRFPPTDTESLRRLLGALMKNDSPFPFLRLYTVLGPDDNPANRRLEALLDFATKQRKIGKVAIKRTNLWAQDFMSVYNPDFIFD